jgi:hypothetical protein
LPKRGPVTSAEAEPHAREAPAFRGAAMAIRLLVAHVEALDDLRQQRRPRERGSERRAPSRPDEGDQFWPG